MIKLDTKSAASARKIPKASPVSSIVAALTRCRLGALQGVATWATARPELSAKFAFYFRLTRYAQFTKKHSLSKSREEKKSTDCDLRRKSTDLKSLRK